MGASLNCSPAAICFFIGNFPISQSGTQPLTGLSFAVGGLQASGAGSLVGAIPFTVDGDPAVFKLVGTEVSRTFIGAPIREPTTFALAGLGMAMLGLMGRRRRH